MGGTSALMRTAAHTRGGYIFAVIIHPSLVNGI